MSLILTDADGVLLDWNASFREWLSDRGYTEIRDDVYDLHICYDIAKEEAKALIRQFNESAAICQIGPFRDSVWWVKRIHQELGYRFRVITSMSLCRYAYGARQINLRNHFGDAIESLISLDTGAGKYDILSRQPKGLYWIEDKYENAIDGYSLGLKSILVEHNHNLDRIPHLPKDVPVVRDWGEIYYIIKHGKQP